MGGKKSVRTRKSGRPKNRGGAVIEQGFQFSASRHRGNKSREGDLEENGARSSVRAGQWISDWLRLRQLAAGSDDVDRRPTAFRSPSYAPAIAAAVGLDYHVRVIDAGGLRGNTLK